MNSNNSPIILLGPTSLRSISLHPKNAPIVFIDGGLLHKDQLELCDHPLLFSIGDGDSSKATLDHHFPEDKDVSDFALALDRFKDEESLHFHCYGLYGERLDHQLANLGEACKVVASNHHRFTFYDETGQRRAAIATGENEFQAHALVSVFSLTLASLKLTGEIKYQGEFTLSPLSSLGLSNKAYGTFSLSSDQPLIITFSDE
ncbi:MAG: hypothetical protein VXV96_00515 [Bdellovibrionota bacterium]|nr:hypothetical protein [Bdellovibrionota bacterium]